jgi:protocatechuate 4,5-dioxygenase beta chain
VANVVEIIGITHSPNMGRMLLEPNPEFAIRKSAEDYDRMRVKMAEAKPDVLVVIASDHLNQFFMDNMPAFLIGKAPVAEGPFPHEIRQHGLTPYRTKVEVEMAKGMLRLAPDFGVDFSFSDEFRIDHAFTIPLGFIRPEMDLPIIPIFTNVMAPPIPTAKRFYDVGRMIRSIIEALPINARVGILASGHMATELGGPKNSRYSADPEFDRRMIQLIGEGKAEEVVQQATWDRLLHAGNNTLGFLNFILLLGVAGAAVPNAVGLHFPEQKAAVPFMAWDVNQKGAAA